MHINEIRPSKEPKLQKKKNKIAGLQNYKKVWPMWTLWKLNCPVHKQHHHKADYIINIVPHLVFLNLKYAVHIKKKEKKNYERNKIQIYIYTPMLINPSHCFFFFFRHFFCFVICWYFCLFTFCTRKIVNEHEMGTRKTQQSNEPTKCNVIIVFFVLCHDGWWMVCMCVCVWRDEASWILRSASF